jgi:hypothetical protein
MATPVVVVSTLTPTALTAHPTTIRAVAAVPVGRPSADRCDEAGDQCEDGQQRSGLGGDVASAG